MYGSWDNVGQQGFSPLSANAGTFNAAFRVDKLKCEHGPTPSRSVAVSANQKFIQPYR